MPGLEKAPLLPLFLFLSLSHFHTFTFSLFHLIDPLQAINSFPSTSIRMAPKASKASTKSEGGGDPAFNFIFSVLKNCEAVKPDWNKVATENGIAYGKNA